MENNNYSNSYDIGEVFENYVQNIIFPKDRYDLIHRTNDYKQNSVRYSEESKRPDFKFRCKKNNYEFYVEAKFRSKFNSDEKLHIIEIGQYNRFKEIDKSECPVLIIIGYEGIASNPKSLSLIRIDKIGYLDLYKSVLKKHEIEKKAFDNDFLNNIVKEDIKLNQPLLSEQTKQAEQLVNVKPQKKNIRNIILAFSIIILGSLMFILLTPNNKNSSSIIEQKSNIAIEHTSERNIQNQIYPSVNTWKRNVLICKSKTLTIRIDETENGLRYVSWSHSRQMSEKPDLILYNGIDESEEFHEGKKWIFKNKSWMYEIDKVNLHESQKEFSIYLKLHQYNELKKTILLKEI